MSIKYQPIQSPPPDDITTVKKEPFKFKWMKNEYPITIAIVAIIMFSSMMDLAILFRRLVTSKGIDIQGVSPGYFGVPRVTYSFVL